MIHESAVIHETASIGLPPGVFGRAEDGSRPPKMVENHGVSVEEDVHVMGLACIVNGTERPTTIRKGARLLNRSHIGHDAIVGEHVIVGGGAFVCGFVEIGDRSELKARVTVRNRKKIGADCIIGMGCVVVKDVPDNTVYFRKGGEVVMQRNRADLPWESPT